MMGDYPLIVNGFTFENNFRIGRDWKPGKRSLDNFHRLATSKDGPEFILGAKGKLPVEVVPFALPLVLRRLAELGCTPIPYEQAGKLFVSDNGNHIIDCGIKPLDNPRATETTIRAIPGVVGTGLFLGMADVVLFGDDRFNLVNEKQRTSDP